MFSCDWQQFITFSDKFRYSSDCPVPIKKGWLSFGENLWSSCGLPKSPVKNVLEVNTG